MRSKTPFVSPVGTTLARHIAALIDNVLVFILLIFVGKQFAEYHVFVQAIAVFSTYFGYYFILEASVSRTVGKLITGLKVVDFDGDRCTWKQIAIRSIFRIFEANLVFPYPAAARIIWSRNKQRFGDVFANTVVVFSQDT